MYIKKFLVPLLVFGLVIFSPLMAQKSGGAEVDIPYQKFVLPNGLTLIVHEDHKAPIVSVNIWYHVGSKNEKPGRTGFAHLFEHLMFNGSENYNDDYFKAMEKIGATGLNGTTNNDRTNYFQNVPVSALDVALWMESDRMGHLLGAIDQAKLDEQRGVVQNEKRQGENEPYAIAEELITKNTYPVGHPYSWTVIGSMEDLNAASLSDVKEWFKTYYGAANAVIVIAGAIDAKTARAKVEKYFGDIPSGPPIAKHQAWIAKRSGTQRQKAHDRVPQARLYKVWNIPQWGSAEGDYLDLVSDILSSGKTSRLYKRLVYDDQIATHVAAYADLNEIAGQFVIQATAKAGEDLGKIEKAIDEELERFIAKGPTPKELERVKAQNEAGFIRRSERIGGFGGKSDILAMNEVFGGSPDFYKVRRKRLSEATASQAQKAAKDWLSDGVYILEIHPFPQFKTAASTVDRSKLPDTEQPPTAQFPKLQRANLSNGMKVILAERRSLPVVNFTLLVDAGYAADQLSLPGAASFTLDMMDEGTKTRNALQINEDLAMLGSTLNTGSNLDMCSVILSTLKQNIDPSIEIFTDVILNPSFPEADFSRMKAQRLAQIQRDKTSPMQMALRVFPALLYGKDHAYGNPFSGSGTEQDAAKMTRNDLMNFHQTWFKPNNATMIVVGDVALNEIIAKFEKAFRNWKQGDVPAKNIRNVNLPSKSSIYIIDKPGAQQSFVLVGHPATPKSDPDNIAIESMNEILGGTFTSRINMNLREDKNWTYGARTRIVGARGQQPFFAYAPVQSDKTKETMIELLSEFRGITADKPVTSEEFEKTKLNRVLELPGTWETINAISGSIGDIVRYGLPDSYNQTLPEKINALKLQDLVSAAKKVVHPDQLVWVVVGDRGKIESGIKELKYGEVKIIDADGNPVK